MTARCERCRARLGRTAGPCPSCGAQPGAELRFEHDALLDGNDVVFEHPPGRRRWIGGGLVAAVVAVAVANALAGGSDGRAASGRAASTFATLASSTPARASATSSEPSTTTTVVPPEVVGAGPLLSEATGIRLALAGTSRLHVLDLDRGVIETVPGSAAYDDIAAVSGGVIAWSEGVVRAVRFDGRTSTNLVASGQILAEGPRGTVWYASYDGGDVWTVSDVAAAPRPAPAFAPDSNGRSARPDGLGGALVQRAGGVFRVAARGGVLVPLAPGELVDVNGAFALTRTCYPDPACELAVVDLRTAARRAVPTAPVDGPVAASAGAQVGRISPDGRWLLSSVMNAAGGAGAPVVLRSTVDGTMVEFASDYQPLSGPLQIDRSSGVVWSPDGRWLFTVTGVDRVSAWREGLAKPITIVLPSTYLMGALAVAVP